MKTYIVQKDGSKVEVEMHQLLIECENNGPSYRITPTEEGLGVRETTWRNLTFTANSSNAFTIRSA